MRVSGSCVPSSESLANGLLGALCHIASCGKKACLACREEQLAEAVRWTAFKRRLARAGRWVEEKDILISAAGRKSLLRSGASSKAIP